MLDGGLETGAVFNPSTMSLIQGGVSEGTSLFLQEQVKKIRNKAVTVAVFMAFDVFCFIKTVKVT